MYSGISGMKAFKSSLDVIGNNIANVNTVAYKAARASFKEMFNQTMRTASSPAGGRGGINPSQVGLGVIVGAVDTDGSQGSMTATGRANDLAIEGNGYFALSSGSRVFYTRDGSFSLDAEHNLVSSGTGLRVMGWTADAATGVLDTTAPVTGASNIEIPVGGLSVARQTENIRLGGNLDASAAIGATYSIKFSVYDSLGLTHDVNVVFTKAANQPAPGNEATWDYEASCPDCGAGAIAAGSITFDEHGYSELPSIDLSLSLTNPNGSVSPLVAKLDTTGVSQLNGKDTVNMTYQDGLPLGTLEGFSIDRTGVISGTFTNGAVRTLGQLALAEFTNPSGLLKNGNSLLSESPNSGSPKFGLPSSGGLGSIDSGFLEASNVDLANEFATMIVAQRGFQANSRIISVSDEVLQDLVTMKR
jgi:flagellar hook protein FlgE